MAARASSPPTARPVARASARPRVGTDDGGRDRAVGRGAGGRVEQMGAPLVGAGRADRGVAGDLDHPDQPPRVPRVGDPDAPGPARIVARVAQGGDVAAGAYQRRSHAGLPQLVDGPGRGPALDQAGRIDSARQGPGIEPSASPLPGPGAAQQDLADLLRRVGQAEISPRRSRLIGLLGFQTLKTASARWRQARAAATASQSRSGGRSGSSTAIDTTVPITGSGTRIIGFPAGRGPIAPTGRRPGW